jgi:pimeloyl-ACP methyl ester carboxylesterase
MTPRAKRQRGNCCRYRTSASGDLSSAGGNFAAHPYDVNPMAASLGTLLLILLAVGAGIYVALPWAMAVKLLRPPRMTDGKAVYLLKRLSPGDLGIPFQDVIYRVRDERTGSVMKITGWWMPAKVASNQTAVLLHGYADAKVGSIAWAPLFRGLGYNVLAIDLRAHGGSDGVNVTAGFWERHDVSQVIDQLKAERPAEAGEVILFGISLGAAVAIAVAAMRDDLAACILESPFADYETAVVAHADLMGMPGPTFVRRAVRAAERLSGSRFIDVAPVALIHKARCRVMVISAGADPLVGTSIVQLGEAVGKRSDGSVHWVVDQAYHVESMHGGMDEYRLRIAEYLHVPVAAQANK